MTEPQMMVQYVTPKGDLTTSGAEMLLSMHREIKAQAALIAALTARVDALEAP